MANHEIETYSGNLVDLANPSPATINLIDIAWGLSRTARFGGHTLGKHAYSVAQHSVWAAWAAQHFYNADARVTLFVLLHDAHEAYMGDIPTPMKCMPGLRSALEDMAAQLQIAIHESLGLDYETGIQNEKYIKSIIKTCDRYALCVEARHLTVSHGVDWPILKNMPDTVRELTLRETESPDDAFSTFWMTHELLTRGNSIKELCA